MPHFNEHALEMAIMELFQNEGYIYMNGEEVHKEVSEVLLRDDLRMYLRSRYAVQGITDVEVTNDEVFKEIFEQAENFKKYNS